MGDATGGTLLSDLDNGPPVSDGDLVNSIYADLNMPSQGNPVMGGGVGGGAPQPPMGVRRPMQSQQGPLPPTMAHSADPAVPTAHMIGREHPTAADFDRMMGQGGPVAFNAMAPQMNQVAPPYYGGGMGPGGYQMAGPSVPAPPTKSAWQSYWSEELKQPLLVAIVVFIMTLPAVHVLANHYVPKLLTPGGTFTTVGLLVRALVGGALYWVLQRVIAPLILSN